MIAALLSSKSSKLNVPTQTTTLLTISSQTNTESHDEEHYICTNDKYKTCCTSSSTPVSDVTGRKAQALTSLPVMQQRFPPWDSGWIYIFYLGELSLTLLSLVCG